MPVLCAVTGTSPAILRAIGNKAAYEWCCTVRFWRVQERAGELTDTVAHPQTITRDHVDTAPGHRWIESPHRTP
jgi:hypothetical protein